VKSTIALLALGKSDFEAIEPFRNDRFCKRALVGLAKVPSSAWLRQRPNKVDAHGKCTELNLAPRIQV